MFNYNDFLNLTRIQAFLNYNNSSNAYFNKSEINATISSLTYFLSKTSDNYNIFCLAKILSFYENDCTIELKF